MYRPFDTRCKCGGVMAPLFEPHQDNTAPTTYNKEVVIDFWCPNCSHAISFTYRLPGVFADVAKNVLFHIGKISSNILTDRITFNTSNSIEIDGLRYALAYLHEKNLVYDILQEDLSFKLTFLGRLMIWHGPY